MSTRAIYKFGGETQEAPVDVYKHHDGYPSGAVLWIRKANKQAAHLLQDYPASPLTRRDAMIIGFLTHNTGHRLISEEKLHGDIEYVYEIQNYGNLENEIKAYYIDHDWENNTSVKKLIFTGSLDEMEEWSKGVEKWATG
jgi:hypothetical protein